MAPQRITKTVVRQFHRPSGLLGRVAGWIMGTRDSNVTRNRWAVEQLDPAPDARILEIGFGPGVAIEAFATRVPDGHVYGLDHSDLMVRTATKRNAAAVREGRVTLRAREVTDLPDDLPPLDLVFA